MLKTARELIAVPIYQRVEHDLRQRIAWRTWPIGAAIPSRKSLAIEYGVTISTIQKAIETLLQEKILEAEAPRGTFVARIPYLTEEDHPAIINDGRQMTAAQGLIAGDAPVHVGVSSSPFLSEGVSSQIQGRIEVALLTRPVDPESNEPDLWDLTVLEAMERSLPPSRCSVHTFGPRRIRRPDSSVYELVESAMSAGVHAIAIIDPFGKLSDQEVLMIARKTEGIPSVLISTVRSFPAMISVSLDDRYAGYQAGQHLVKAGCKSFLFLPNIQMPWAQDRLAGIRLAMEHAEIPPNALQVIPEVPDMPVDGNRVFTHTYQISQRFLTTSNPPEGVVGANDVMSTAFIHAATEAGFQCGKDYRLVGFDNSSHARSVGLTSLRPPLEAMGEQAARLLMNAVDGKIRKQQLQLHWDLVVRSSTRSYCARESDDRLAHAF